MSKRTLACVLGVLTLFAATATATAAPPPVQTVDQSGTSAQGAVATSGATQVDPSNTNIAIRVFSPGNDGSVTQSNDVESKAEAENENSTDQTAGQTQAGAGGIQTSTQSAANAQLAAALSAAAQVGASNSNMPVRVGSEGDNGSVTQSNDASSKAEAENENTTTQDAGQSQGGSSCCTTSAPKTADPCCATTPSVQASDQSARNTQVAGAQSTVLQSKPSNTNVSIRVGSEGDNGSVTQSNDASSKAEAENENTTTQDAGQSQGGASTGPAGGCCSSGSGIQTSNQDATNHQAAGASSSAVQEKPKNTNIAIRVFSPGNDGNVNQTNSVSSRAEAENENATTQTAAQSQGSGHSVPTTRTPGESCGCGSGSGIQTSDQSAANGQLALAKSDAIQIGAKNVNMPIRVGSDGNDGSVVQSNDVSSKAEAENENATTQDAGQSIGSGGSGGSGTAIQTGYQSSLNGQLTGAASSAAQLGASNANHPVRVKSEGGGGSIVQSNDVSSKAEAENENTTDQGLDQVHQAGSGCGCQGGIGIQVSGQKSISEQAALAHSAALQDFGRSDCGCSAGGNTNSPTRVYSTGDDGRVRQSNDVSSKAEAENENATDQTADQKQYGGSGIGIQVAAQQAWNAQLAAAHSVAAQLGASNRNAPTRVYSPGGGGSVAQSNDASSKAEAENENATTQDADQWQRGTRCGCAGALGIQVAGQSAKNLQAAAALSAAMQLKPSNSNAQTSVWSDGTGGSTYQDNDARSKGEAENENTLDQLAHQFEL